MTSTSVAGLPAFLSTCAGGEVVTVTGTGSLDLAGVNPASTVTIIGGDFTGATLKNCSNLQFLSDPETGNPTTFQYTFAPGDRFNHIPFGLFGCAMVKFSEAVFMGDRGNGVLSNGQTMTDSPWAEGPFVRDCIGIDFDGVHIEGFLQNLTFYKSHGCSLIDSTTKGQGNDAVRAVASNDIRIMRNNHFGNAADPANKLHPDVLHSYDPAGDAAGNGPCLNLWIIDNLVWMVGVVPNSAYMLQEYGSLPMTGLRVEGNDIFCQMPSAISTWGAYGAMIARNCIAQLPTLSGETDPFTPKIIMRKDGDGDVVENVVVAPTGDGMSFQKYNWRVSGNRRVATLDEAFVMPDPADPLTWTRLDGTPLDRKLRLGGSVPVPTPVPVPDPEPIPDPDPTPDPVDPEPIPEPDQAPEPESDMAALARHFEAIAAVLSGMSKD